MENKELLEKNLRVCKECMTLKLRVVAGKFKNSKGNKYRDSEGKLWNGRTCPDCHKIRIRNEKRERDAKAKQAQQAETNCNENNS